MPPVPRFTWYRRHVVLFIPVTMNLHELQTRVDALALDTARSVEQRIDDIFELRSTLMTDDETVQHQYDAIYLSTLLEMVSASNTDHNYDIELFQICTMLAETYDELNDYRPMKNVITKALWLLENCDVSYQVIDYAIPRIIESVKHSVYHHDRYRLLAAFLRFAWETECSGDYINRENVNKLMRQMLNLRGLLPDATRPDLLDADLQIFIARYIKPDEFSTIIDHPHEGHLRRDPVEYTLRWEEVYYDVTDELDRYFADTPRHMGFCFQYWAAQTDLLRTKYNIEWKNPHLMNPGVMFD